MSTVSLLNHYLNHYTLFSLFLPCSPLADRLSHSSETIFSAKLSQGHAAALHRTQPGVCESLGHVGSSWQGRAHFSCLQRSLLIPKAEILLWYLSTQFEAWAAKMKPQGPRLSHGAASMCPPAQEGQPVNGPTTRAASNACMGWVTPAVSHRCSPSIMKHYQKEK